MAKTRYKKEKFHGNFSCGHEGHITVGGNSKDYRTQIAKGRFAGLCPECEQKAKEEDRAEESRQNAEFASEQGWAELTGSPKQIAWAETLRKNLFDMDYDRLTSSLRFSSDNAWNKYLDPFVDLDAMDAKVKEMREEGLGRLKIQRAMENEVFTAIHQAVENLLKVEGDAKFFIDNRKWSNLLEILAPYAGDDFGEEYEQEQKILAENTILPEEYNDVVVTIREEKDTVAIKSPKNDEVIETAKSLGYSWERRAWRRKIDKFSGPLSDRIAEVSHKLLSKGFGVTLDVSDPEAVKTMVKDASFKPEQKAWIKRVVKFKSFIITLPYHNDNLYNDAIRIHGAKWSREHKGILIPVSSYKQVEDYAAVNGFSLSSGAEELIYQYKEELAEAERVAVSEQAPINKKDGLVELLDSPDDILPELKDEL